MGSYEYEICYRIDEDCWLPTDDTTVKGDCIEDIVENIKRIERRNTIISIENMSLGYYSRSREKYKRVELSKKRFRKHKKIEHSKRRFRRYLYG